MRVLIVSSWGGGCDLAIRMISFGHDVKAYIKLPAYKNICDGIVPKIDKWESEVYKSDLIIFDDIGFGSAADFYRSKGLKVFGGSKYTDELEENRQFGASEAKSVGINVPKTLRFNNIDKAISFIKSSPKKYVIKPNGDTDKDLVYVGEMDNGFDVIEMLDSYKKKMKKVDFELQERVDGIEFAVGTIFNGKDFVQPVEYNWEHKKIASGNIGFLTGEMGTVQRHLTGGKLFNETLLKMKDKLTKAKYVGYIDANCIVNEKGSHFLEFTCRPGYPSINLSDEVFKGDWAKFYLDVCNGSTKFNVSDNYIIGVVYAAPGFPFPEAYKKRGLDLPVIGINENNVDHVHFIEVKQENGKLETCGESGYPLVVTHQGKTIEEAKKNVYDILIKKEVFIPKGFFRNNISDRVVTSLPKLKSWGYNV